MEQLKRKPGRPPRNTSVDEAIEQIDGHEEYETESTGNFISEQSQTISTQDNADMETGSISDAQPPTENPNQPVAESPVSGDLPEGWSDILSAPRNGTPVTVSNANDEANAYWKRTRAFANATHRWEETGFWTGELSGQKIPFVPTMWKVRERRR